MRFFVPLTTNIIRKRRVYMKTKIIVLALALLSTINVVFSQTSTGKTGALLWKISGQDLDKPSYILGTFHLKPAEFLDSIPEARTALLSAEQVVGELSLSDMGSLQLQMQQTMMMPSDTTYQMLFSEEDYQFVSEQLSASIGIGLDQLRVLKPAGINMTHVVIMYQKLLPAVNPANTIDIAVQNIAMENDKPILGLETVDKQIYALFGASLKRQAELLLCNLKNKEYEISTIKSVIEYYNRFDLGKLYEISMSDDNPCLSSQEEINRLNKDRNDSWMKILPDLMKDKSSFIAVGALHLAGEEGLLNQLEKLGYKVEPVK